MHYAVVLPLPAKELSVNQKTHWGKKAPIIKSHRKYAENMASTAFQLTKPKVISYELHFYWGDERRRDEDNAAASCKPYLDGISDYLEQDDSEFSFNGVKFFVDKERTRVQICIYAIRRD